MNEQQLADLFSEQVDHMLDGESTAMPPNVEDLPELLDIVGQATSQTEFQAGSAAQATFQSQLAGWFGLSKTDHRNIVLMFMLMQRFLCVQ